jgi:hypothetical protein
VRLEEHAVHRLANADEKSLREALEGTLQIVLEADVRAAGREPEVRRSDERAAQLGEELVEPPEDRITRNAHEDQPVQLFGESPDAVGGLVLHLLHQILEVCGSLLRAAQSVGDPQVDRSVRQGAEQRGPVPVEFQHPLPAAMHDVRVLEVLAQPVLVEPHLRYPFQEWNELPKLLGHVQEVVLESGVVPRRYLRGGPRSRNIQREGRHAVHPRPDLGPLDVGVAGVRVHGDRRPWHATHGVISSTQLRRHVGLDVSADVR